MPQIGSDTLEPTHLYPTDTPGPRFMEKAPPPTDTPLCPSPCTRGQQYDNNNNSTNTIIYNAAGVTTRAPYKAPTYFSHRYQLWISCVRTTTPPADQRSAIRRGHSGATLRSSLTALTTTTKTTGQRRQVDLACGVNQLMRQGALKSRDLTTRHHIARVDIARLVSVFE